MKQVIYTLFLGGCLFLTSCKDKCKDIVCENAGTCNDGVCECTEGYEGESCETLSISKYFGTYLVTPSEEECEGLSILGQNIDLSQFINNGTDPFVLKVSQDGSSINKVLLQHLTDPSVLNLKATVNGSSFVIASQPGETTTVLSFDLSSDVSGSGSFSQNQINISLTKVRSAANQTSECSQTLSGTKQ